MKILVRLPNWLGDMVMSIAFLELLRKEYTEATISVIVKKELEPLLDYFPPFDRKYIFSKKEYPGVNGVFRFGKQIKRENKFDLFFTVPDSFSSALMGFATGATKRVGYANEGRSFLLTKSFKKDPSVHRVIQYVDLLQQFTGKQFSVTEVKFSGLPAANEKRSVLVNIHSEAISRRLPIAKAVTVITDLQRKITTPITLIGGPGDVSYTKEVIDALPSIDNIINKAGEIPLSQLPIVMNNAAVLLSTDSGPAHIASAAGLPLVVLFGAGNENSTAPFNKENRTIIRLGQLPCEPCVKNTCIFGLPKCLEQLDENKISNAVLNYLKS